MVRQSLRVTQHVFGTLTYKREYDLVECWKRITKDFNRFIQNYRRLHRDGVEYIRSIEAHADNYPHLHAVLQHKSGITVTTAGYFENGLYQKWKALWGFGLSDFQAPYNGSVYPTLYIVKYISKDATLKTLWKKFYKESGNQSPTSAIGATPYTSQTNTSQNTDIKNLATIQNNPSLFFCHQFKIKQVTWSRGYRFPTKRLMLSPPQTQGLITREDK